MIEDPLQELRTLRHHIEQACTERGQTYADYLSQVQRQYTDRLVRRGPKPRLKVKERRVAQEGATKT
ncbi:MAG TPA: hypothetical protein VIH59_14575 [Candidatus Tectomicrobia bacterium]|jgi:hypothetical protein